MSLKMYQYDHCGTCRKAKQWLRAQGIAFETMAIRETPPPLAALKTMLKAYGGDLRKLFNTSGGDYKAMNLKERLPGMPENEALELLATNGNLVKRPFLIGEGVALVGFREDQWHDALIK